MYNRWKPASSSSMRYTLSTYACPLVKASPALLTCAPLYIRDKSTRNSGFGSRPVGCSSTRSTSASLLCHSGTCVYRHILSYVYAYAPLYTCCVRSVLWYTTYSNIILNVYYYTMLYYNICYTKLYYVYYCGMHIMFYVYYYMHHILLYVSFTVLYYILY